MECTQGYCRWYYATAEGVRNFVFSNHFVSHFSRTQDSFPTNTHSQHDIIRISRTMELIELYCYQQLQPKFYKYCVSKHSYMYIYPVWTFIFIPVWLFIFIMSAWIDKCIFSLFREPGPSVPSPVIDLTHTLGPLVPQLWEMGFSYHQISSGRMIKCGKDFPWLLGSNDPNTIPDPTRIRCLVSVWFLMFPLGLRCVWT